MASWSPIGGWLITEGTSRSATGASRRRRSICLRANRLAPVRWTVWLAEKSRRQLLCRAFFQRFGLSHSPGHSIQGSQILQARDHIGVDGAERLLANRQRALVERLRLGIVALGFVEHGQVVQAHGDIGVVGAERLLPD